MKKSTDSDNLMERIEERNRRIKRWTLVLTAVPTILAMALLSFSIYALVKTNNQLRILQKQVKFQKNQLDSLRQELAETVNFVHNVYQLDWSNVKFLASRYPLQAGLLLRIWDMKTRGVGWRLEGYSPDDGFDSPSFVTYLLETAGLLEDGRTIRYDLATKLQRTDSLRVGDIILYEAGYAMFYFEDRDGAAFCIGMTPIGILTLKVNFGPPIIGYFNSSRGSG